MKSLTQYRPNSNYKQGYVDELFLLWWKQGRPGAVKFHAMMPPNEEGDKPSIDTLNKWKKDWVAKADELDAEFYGQVTAEAMAEKAEMLKRHTKVGTKMQDMAMEYLEQNESELTVNSSIRLLIEGVRIERESRGIPDALSKLSEKSDDELLNELQKLMSGDLIDIQVIDDE